MKRVLLSIVASLAMAIAPLAIISPAAMATSNGPDCEGTAHLTSHHMHIGSGTVTEAFTVSDGCPITLSLVSYEAANTHSFPQNLPQTLFDSKTMTVGEGVYIWQVDMPSCFAQADFVHGNVITNLSESDHYGSKVIDTGLSGNKACQNNTITVNKATVPSGDTTSFSITISSSDGGQVLGDATQNIVGGGSVVYQVSPGTYSVTEASLSGWTQTSNDCTNLEVNSPDSNPTCTIVNTKTTTPPSGGQGGGLVLGATTTQVQAPTGGVGAGFGGASTTTSIGAIVGLVGSVGAVGYGLRRFAKFEL